jgi:arginine deiminase
MRITLTRWEAQGMGCKIEYLDRAKKAGPGIAYGYDEPGRLKSVLVHTPREELSLINESNLKTGEET